MDGFFVGSTMAKWKLVLSTVIQTNRNHTPTIAARASIQYCRLLSAAVPSLRCSFALRILWSHVRDQNPGSMEGHCRPVLCKEITRFKKYTFKRLILQLLPNLQTTFVSKWVHDVSRHPQLLSSHQITSENRLVDYTPESSIRSWRRYRRWYFRSVR